MTEDRIHRAVSPDGTRLAGHVHGQGPPLVLVHGAVADEHEWDAAVPLLAEHFTCFTMSTRCRGLSGHSDDLSPDQLVADVAAFADSIGERVRLAGISGGGMFALGAAARAASLVAVAVWEPPVFEVIDDLLVESFQRVLSRMQELHTAGESVEAARTFLSFVGNDRELASLAATGEIAAGSRYMSTDLEEIAQAASGASTSPTDPAVLHRITAPVLLGLGAASTRKKWFQAGAEFAAEHIPDARIRTIPGVGHLSCQVTPAPIVRELVDFFTSVSTSPAPALP